MTIAHVCDHCRQVIPGDAAVTVRVASEPERDFHDLVCLARWIRSIRTSGVRRPGPTRAIPDEVFLAVWNETPDVQLVAERLEQSLSSVYRYKARLMGPSRNSGRRAG